MIKEQILDMLKKHSLTEKLIFEIFSENEEVKNALQELVEEAKVVKVRREYCTPESLHLIKGKIVSIKERYSFATIYQEEDVYIDNSNLNSAFKGDEVFLRKVKSTYREEYEVFSIIKRERQIVCGEIVKYYSTWLLDVKDIAYKGMTFLINPTEVKLFEGNIALCTIAKQTKNTTYVDIIKIIGNKNEPGVDIAKIIYGNGAPIEFPDEVREQVNSIPSIVTEKEKEGREDFTKHCIVTIDGDDAKDFDDAVEVKRIKEGYEVGVHIADVAHYVTYRSPLDIEAMQRGTSIYVVDRVVPMLPFELSNGICSLNPDVERLVTSCIFKVDNYGNILDSRITKGVIRSHARLTYNYVNKLLHNEHIDNHFSEEIDNMLFLLNEVSTKIRKRRERNGCLDLESTELKFICDENSFPIEVIKRKQEEGEKLIEDLMITANELVAEYFQKRKLPSIYRIHEQPKSKKMSSFIKLANHLGYKCNLSSLDVTPEELSSFMNKYRNDEKYPILSMMLLRSLAKARYCTQNLGHYGLASECYTHFTSPIRRYPDLLVHRLLDKYLVQKDFDIGKDFEEELDYLAENSSIHERRAITIERAVDDLASSKFMSKRVGNRYFGFINSMTQNGMFVEIEEYGIDGFIPFESLEDDFYIFNEDYCACVGKNSKRRYNLGDRVEVIVAQVEIATSQITFMLVQNNVKQNSKKNIVGRKRKGRKNGRR